MPSDNAELARRGYAAFAAGDLDALAEILHEDFVLYDSALLPDQGVYRGFEGFLENYRKLLDSFEEFTVEPEEIVDVGDDRLVVALRMSGRGKGSQVAVEARLAHLWTVRDGRAVELRVYNTKEAALEAAGG